jgi:hypothetical protein
VFEKLFDFSYQRTPLQALGWYLFYLLIAMLIGFIVGVIAAPFLAPGGDIKASVGAGILVGQYLGPIFPIVIAGLFLWSRPMTAMNLVGTLIAVIVGAFVGWLGAGIVLALLTTRPSRVVANGSSTGGI